MDGTSTGDAAVPDGRIKGRPVEDAIDAVVDSGVGEATARAALDHVTVDGVVTRDAVEEAIAHVSKVVATPETRAELAASELADARAAAEDATEFDTVAARLDRFESRLGRIEADVDQLGTRLDDLVDRRDALTLWDLAVELDELTRDADAAQRRADELAAAVEEFEDWLKDPQRRVAEVRQDCDALRESIAELEAAFEAAMDGDAEDPALAWADTSLRARLFGVLLDDLRIECEDLRTWVEEEPAEGGPETGGGPGAIEAVGQLVLQLEDRIEALQRRLDEAAESDWRDRYGDGINAFEEALADHEPPIDAERVEALFAEHRASITGDG